MIWFDNICYDDDKNMSRYIDNLIMKTLFDKQLITVTIDIDVGWGFFASPKCLMVDFIVHQHVEEFL